MRLLLALSQHINAVQLALGVALHLKRELCLTSSVFCFRQTNVHRFEGVDAPRQQG
jgi:hypothetical protein